MESFKLPSALIAREMLGWVSDEVLRIMPVCLGAQTICLNIRHPHPHHRNQHAKVDEANAHGSIGQEAIVGRASHRF
jgi:hypothetical protein